MSVLLHGADDARTLRENKFSYTIDIPDMLRNDIRDRAADARYASRVRASALPSGRDAYRRLPDYSEDLKKLVDENPGLVRPITLPHKTWEGRTVEGVEITTNVDNLRDGKPVFVEMGVHHAREWPSGEHTIEWAFELVNGYKSGDARARRLVQGVRTIVIPIVNPDGFNISREAGEAQGGGDGRGAPNPGEDNETANIVAHPFEYRRKNCRLPEGDSGTCAGPSAGVASTGVDPNRNYGAFWGGPGASGDFSNETYYGPGPFSEPESQNIRDLVSSRQVTTLITNHTFSDLVLRAPGLKSQGLAPDEAAMKALGDSMAAENGYLSMYGWQLYDTTGTTEDWSYSATGGYGYTFEIGCTDLNRTTNECITGHFHPPFAEMVKEWEGTTPQADEGGRDGHGNREAYYKAMENALNRTQHSVLSGKAPAGILIRLQKTFETPTSQDNDGNGQPDTFTDHLDTTYEVPANGALDWDINPSTRPLVAIDHGRPPHGEASPPQSFPGNAPPVPACPTYPDTLPGCFREHSIEVPSGPGIDNGFATVRIEWPTAGSDYDLYLFKDTNGNGIADAGEPTEGSSTQGTTDFEQVTLGPDPSGKYVVRVVNWAATEPYDLTWPSRSPRSRPPSGRTGRCRARPSAARCWPSATCSSRAASARTSTLAACAAALDQAFESGEGCDQPTGRLRGRRLDRVRLGGDREAHLRAYKIGRKQTRKGIDRFCLSDGRGVRVGYPTSRLKRKLRRAERRRYANGKALLALTTSRAFRARRIRVGSSRRRRHAQGRRPADQDRIEPLVPEARQAVDARLQGSPAARCVSSGSRTSGSRPAAGRPGGRSLPGGFARVERVRNGTYLGSAANRRRLKGQLMNDGVSRVSLEIGGSSISFETGKYAKQASGAVVVQAGDTMVLCTATAGEPARRGLPSSDGRRRGADVRRGQDPRQLLQARGQGGREGHAHRAHDRPAAAAALPEGLEPRDAARVDPHVDRPRAPLRHPRDERHQRRADGLGHPVPGAGRRRAHRPGRRGQLPRQPRRGVAARVAARPRGRRHRGGHPDGRGGRQRDHRGGDPRRARHRAPGDQAPLRGAARPAQAGRQGEDRDRAAAGGRVDPEPGPGALRRGPRRGDPGGRQARAPGRHEARRGGGARGARHDDRDRRGRR